MRVQRRKAVEGVSLSFLDVISCGFGAILLMLVLVRTFSPQITSIVYDTDDLEKIFSALLEENQEIERNLIKLEILRTDQKEKANKFSVKLESLNEKERNLSRRNDKTKEKNQNLSEKKEEIEDEINSFQKGDRFVESKNIAGITVDSEHVIFIIDTSGSMRSEWETVITKIQKILITYPNLEGIQIINADGQFFLPYQGQWLNAARKDRKEIIKKIINYPILSGSNPMKGLKKAIIDFRSSDKDIAIWIFGDDYQTPIGPGSRRGNTVTIAEVVRLLEKLKVKDELSGSQSRKLTINAIGFRTGLTENGRMEFALAMRELCERNGGAFIGL
tara:strand:+ start:30 stop:1025 length:996 start_codon:yes stop_codon:yes gene_type:complete